MRADQHGEAIRSIELGGGCGRTLHRLGNRRARLKREQERISTREKPPRLDLEERPRHDAASASQ